MIAQTLDSIVQFLGGHPLLALLIVFAVSLGEALLIVGLVMPSTVILVGAGTMIGLGRLPFLPIFVATSLGAFGPSGLAVAVLLLWRSTRPQRRAGMNPAARGAER